MFLSYTNFYQEIGLNKSQLNLCQSPGICARNCTSMKKQNHSKSHDWRRQMLQVSMAFISNKKLTILSLIWLTLYIFPNLHSSNTIYIMILFLSYFLSPLSILLWTSIQMINLTVLKYTGYLCSKGKWKKNFQICIQKVAWL